MKRIFSAILVFFIFLFNLNLYSNELTSPKYIFLSTGENQFEDISVPNFFPSGPLTTDNKIFSLGAGFDIGNNLLEISYVDYGRQASQGYFADEYSLIQFNNVMESSFAEKITGYLKFGISYLSIKNIRATLPQNYIGAVRLQESSEKFELVYGLGINFDVEESYNFFIEFMDSGHNISSSYSLGVKFFLNK